MRPSKLSLAAAFVALPYLALKVSAQGPPVACKYAQDLRKFQKPILNSPFSVDKKGGVENTWDSNVKDLGIQVTGDFKTPAKYHLSITAPDKQAPGQYIVVATMPDGHEKWIWLKGKASCDIADLKDVPTKLAVATINYAAMDARNADGGRVTPCSPVTADDMADFQGTGGTQMNLVQDWPLVWSKDIPGTHKWSIDMRSNRVDLLHLSSDDAFTQYWFQINLKNGGKLQWWLNQSKGKGACSMPLSFDPLAVQDAYSYLIERRS